MLCIAAKRPELLEPVKPIKMEVTPQPEAKPEFTDVRKPLETVYENIHPTASTVKIPVREKPNDRKKLEPSSSKKCAPKTEVCRPKPRNSASERKVESDSSEFSHNRDHFGVNSSLEEFYRAGMLNGSSYHEYEVPGPPHHLQSKYVYSMAGMPGSAAQSSAAAAFFAR